MGPNVLSFENMGPNCGKRGSVPACNQQIIEEEWLQGNILHHCVDIVNFQKKNRECNFCQKNVGVFLRIMLVMKNSRRFNYKH